MIRRPPRSTRTYTLFPYTTLFRSAAAIMHMLSNNLDYAVAQHPHELITYGGNGAVFQNWAQYLLTMKYLATMTDEQTLVMRSEEHTSELQSLMRISYAVFCLKKKNTNDNDTTI